MIARNAHRLLLTANPATLLVFCQRSIRIATTSNCSNDTSNNYNYMSQLMRETVKSRLQRDGPNIKPSISRLLEEVDSHASTTQSNELSTQLQPIDMDTVVEDVDSPEENSEVVISPGQTVEESLAAVQKSLENLDLDDFKPVLQPAGNLAAYVPRVETLSKLVELGVNLSRVEQVPGAANLLVKLNFDSEVKPFIFFLTDLGFPAETVARIFTIYPKIFKNSLEDLESRLGYFGSKKFSHDAIIQIFTHQPTIFSLTSARVDKQLGRLQKMFVLTGDELRNMVTDSPKIVTFPVEHFQDLQVTFKRMMGFKAEEIHAMVTACPKLLLKSRRMMAKNCVYLHRNVDLEHAYISQYPEALTVSHRILKERLEFLQQIGRLQLDPTKELFTPLDSIVKHRDEEFCQMYAKTDIDEYNRYLKTL